MRTLGNLTPDEQEHLSSSLIRSPLLSADQDSPTSLCTQCLLLVARFDSEEQVKDKKINLRYATTVYTANESFFSFFRISFYYKILTCITLQYYCKALLATCIKFLKKLLKCEP